VPIEREEAGALRVDELYLVVEPVRTTLSFLRHH
jgi:hypothetical protein